jgi:hypothetical protein
MVNAKASVKAVKIRGWVSQPGTKNFHETEIPSAFAQVPSQTDEFWVMGSENKLPPARLHVEQGQLFMRHLRASGAEGATNQTQAVFWDISEEDAARAYDSAALQARQGAKRNFPSEAIGELPVTEGAKRKQHKRRTQEGHTRGAHTCHG